MNTTKEVGHAIVALQAGIRKARGNGFRRILHGAQQASVLTAMIEDIRYLDRWERASTRRKGSGKETGGKI